MANQFDKKIIWTIKNVSSLPSDVIISDSFIVGGCKWNLLAYPKCIHDSTHFSLYLGVANLLAYPKSLPCGSRRHAKFRLTIVNQSSDKLSHSKVQDSGDWFDEKTPQWGFECMLPLSKIHGKDSGFLLNGELKTIVEIKVLEVIGKSDVTEETSTITEDVHGFVLPHSQEKSVSLLFERHPEIASDFCPKNPNLRTGYMSLLLSLIETICRLPQEASGDDLFHAYAALGSLKNAGFKLAWLEKKLNELSKRIEIKKGSEAELPEMENELNDLKQSV